MSDRLIFSIVGFVVVNILSVVVVFQVVDWNNTRVVKRVFGYGFLLSLIAFIAIFIFWKDSFLS